MTITELRTTLAMTLKEKVAENEATGTAMIGSLRRGRQDHSKKYANYTTISNPPICLLLKKLPLVSAQGLAHLLVFTTIKKQNHASRVQNSHILCFAFRILSYDKDPNVVFLQEIRNKIYKLLLVDEAPINPGAHHPCDCWDSPNLPKASSLSLTILRTCRTIMEEASAILYGSNVFFISFCKGFGLFKLEILQSIKTNGWAYGRLNEDTTVKESAALFRDPNLAKIKH